MQHKRLSVYYFKGQDFHFHPGQVRDDMKRLRDAAVDSINVCIHEADLCGSNIGRICEAARNAGLQAWAVPSRVGGLVAGWHRAPGHLAASRTDLWARNADGSPMNFFGPQLSVHHPGTLDAVHDVIDQMLSRFPIDGLIWDELKTLDVTDHSQAALDAAGAPSTGQFQVLATAKFFSSLNQRLKANHPKLNLALFVYALLDDSVAEPCANIAELDEFGCDGKCLRPEDPPAGEGRSAKILLPANFARFQRLAKSAGCRSFCLMETQMFARPGLETTLLRMDEFLAMNPDHLVYYDYPLGMADAEWFMPLHAQRLRAWRLT